MHGGPADDEDPAIGLDTQVHKHYNVYTQGSRSYRLYIDRVFRTYIVGYIHSPPSESYSHNSDFAKDI